jgi:hypothetical protein
MNAIRLFISALILTLVVVAVLGIVWWQAPPEKLLAYEIGGKVILGVLAFSGLLGLWQLWTPPSSSLSLR